MLPGSSRRSVGLAVQKTSTQRRMTPSADDAMLGASTMNPQNKVRYQQVDPHPLPIVERTASAVMPAATQLFSTSVPRCRNCTDNMLGSARPKKQAGIQTANWSRQTCLYHRFQRGSDL